MKRQKRDRLERAQAKGYQAGVSGRSSETCPYQDIETKSHWLSGWRDGRETKVVMLVK